MSSWHYGVSCDACSFKNFKLRRYKCLICFDYDLCGSCYDNRKETNQHLSIHPMQCLLTKRDYDVFYQGEAGSPNLSLSLTCPLCGQLGFSESGFANHVFREHPSSSRSVKSSVICPLCVCCPGKSQNIHIQDLALHLTNEHRLRASTEDPVPLPNLSRDVVFPNSDFFLLNLFGQQQLRLRQKGIIGSGNSASSRSKPKNSPHSSRRRGDFRHRPNKEETVRHKNSSLRGHGGSYPAKSPLEKSFDPSLLPHLNREVATKSKPMSSDVPSRFDESVHDSSKSPGHDRINITLEADSSESVARAEQDTSRQDRSTLDYILDDRILSTPVTVLIKKRRSNSHKTENCTDEKVENSTVSDSNIFSPQIGTDSSLQSKLSNFPAKTVHTHTHVAGSITNTQLSEQPTAISQPHPNQVHGYTSHLDEHWSSFLHELIWSSLKSIRLDDVD